MIDGADLLALVGDQAVALVEKQNAKLLLVGERHGGAAVVDERRPGREHRATLRLHFQKAVRGGFYHFELGDGRLAKPRLRQQLRRRTDHLGERSESFEQAFRKRLHVTPRDRTEQNELQKFIVGQCITAGGEEPRAQPLAMAVIMRHRRRVGLVGLGQQRPPRLPVRRSADYGAGYGGRSKPRGDRVKISTPSLVTPTACSNCADSERARVTAVHPSESTFTCGRPRLIIGSTVKIMPGRKVMPSPGRPTWMMFGSSWNRRPTP